MSTFDLRKTARLLLAPTLAVLTACPDDPAAEGDGTAGTSTGHSDHDSTAAEPPVDTSGTPPVDTSATTSDPDDTGTDSGSATVGETGTDTDTDTDTGVELELAINRIGRYAPEPLADIFGLGAAEISAFDPISQSLFVTNGNTSTIDVLDLSDPTNPSFAQTLSPSDPTLDGPTSVAVFGGVVAAAFPSATATDPGAVVFFASDGTELSQVTVGFLPDMVAFSPDGSWVLVACEGEPTGYGPGYSDPEGSVAIIDVSAGPENVTALDVTLAGFGGFAMGDLDGTTRVFGPGSTIAQDLEPEYVAISSDSSTAWVTLQENNAMATIDIASATVTSIVGLGLVDHSMSGLDPSDQDAGIDIRLAPVHGMRQPDSIAMLELGGSTYLFTANEGDARDYPGLDEASRISSLTLDPAAFPDAAELQMNANLGRLQVSNVAGDVDDDGDFDELWVFGSRSVSAFDPSGTLLWDSGDEIEQTTAAALPDAFNSDEDDNDSFEGRSDNKGPEPEGLALGTAFGTPYLFVGLERIGGFMVYDLTDPASPLLWGYINPRDFAGDPEAGTADDLAPEGLAFVSEADSPTGNPLLVVSHEISGTVSIYELTRVAK